MLGSQVDAVEESVIKIVGYVLAAPKDAVDHFRRHPKYENWSLFSSGGVPPFLRTGVGVTFEWVGLLIRNGLVSWRLKEHCSYEI